MPYSFTQIEKDKSKTIWIVFYFLIFFYFAMFYVISLAVKFYLYFDRCSDHQFNCQPFTFFNFVETVGLLMLASFVGIIHWVISTHRLIDKILNIMKAESPALNDTYHQMFRNIVEEVSVATGGVKIEAVVVPSMAMNAFALSDFNGRHVIGATEGLLSRLPRAQIEAVVGHEAAHIVSGDCLSTTVTSSLFQMYAMMIKSFENAVGNSNQRYYRIGSSRSSGGGAALILFIYLILKLTKFCSDLMQMFISREREYRADAVAVRLTRDPLSLSGALYAIGNKWRGSGLYIEEMKPIFIINPNISELDDEEGFWADLFSTHPPLSKRIDVLVNMARVNVETLEENFRALENKPRMDIPQLSSQHAAVINNWFVNQGGQWSGPFDITQIAGLKNFTPETWVKKMGDSEVKFAYQEPEIVNEVIKKDKDSQGKAVCPKCSVNLQPLNYEGVEIHQCGFCKGSLLPRKDVEKIIMRREIGFPPEVIHEAQKIMQQNEKGLVPPLSKVKGAELYNCSVCINFPRKMLKRPYNGAYFIEVDECVFCGYIWFDSPELEVLQYMIEKNTGQLPS